MAFNRYYREAEFIPPPLNTAYGRGGLETYRNKERRGTYACDNLLPLLHKDVVVYSGVFRKFGCLIEVNEHSILLLKDDFRGHHTVKYMIPIEAIDIIEYCGK